MYHVNTMFRGINYHGKLLFAMVVLHFEPYTMVKPRFFDVHHGNTTYRGSQVTVF